MPFMRVRWTAGIMMAATDTALTSHAPAQQRQAASPTRDESPALKHPGHAAFQRLPRLIRCR